jgi:hypothetical protein
MADIGIMVLMAPLPGQRLVDGAEPEDGSILAYRKNGDEGLFASWFIDDREDKPGRPMVWIPIGEFSPDPEAIRPPEIVETGEPQETDDGSQERPVEEGPFGRGRRRSQRPEA